MNAQPGGVLKHLSKNSDSTRTDFEKVIDHPLMIITKGPNYTVTRDFVNYMQGDMDFANFLTSFSCIDQYEIVV